MMEQRLKADNYKSLSAMAEQALKDKFLTPGRMEASISEMLAIPFKTIDMRMDSMADILEAQTEAMQVLVKAVNTQNSRIDKLLSSVEFEVAEDVLVDGDGVVQEAHGDWS